MTSLEPHRTFRQTCVHAPDAVMRVLAAALDAPDVTLVIDVDTLERSALARLDRVMLLAIQALRRGGIGIVLVARYERERAARMQQALPGAACIHPNELATWLGAHGSVATARAIVLTDDPHLLVHLGSSDCGLALGRPELAASNIAALGDIAVRATLWWMLEARTRARAA